MKTDKQQKNEVYLSPPTIFKKQNQTTLITILDGCAMDAMEFFVGLVLL
jgi:hypothetical protein